MYDTHYYSSPDYENTYQVTIETCNKCGRDGNITINRYEDKIITKEISHTCNNKNPERERESKFDNTFSLTV
jgi:hypothetical protein